MDDTNLAYLCDEKMREAARQRGDDPNELPHRYARFINKVVAQKPAGMTLAMHLCRGNFKSTHAAAGNYEPVAEALLAEMNLDAYFLEYDDDRSGDFRPLRYLPKGKTVVLGLVTTKFGEMESKDDAEAPHRRGRRSTRRWSSWPVAAMRLLQHGARQQHRGRGAARQAAAGGGDGGRGLGTLAILARRKRAASDLLEDLVDRQVEGDRGRVLRDVGPARRAGAEIDQDHRLLDVGQEARLLRGEALDDLVALGVEGALAGRRRA